MAIGRGVKWPLRGELTMPCAASPLVIARGSLLVIARGVAWPLLGDSALPLRMESPGQCEGSRLASAWEPAGLPWRGKSAGHCARTRLAMARGDGWPWRRESSGHGA